MNSNGEETYSVYVYNKLGVTYVFAYPDIFGADNKDGLENWQIEDPTNRVLEFVPNKSVAQLMSEVYNLK